MITHLRLKRCRPAESAPSYMTYTLPQPFPRHNREMADGFVSAALPGWEILGYYDHNPDQSAGLWAVEGPETVSAECPGWRAA